MDERHDGVERHQALSVRFVPYGVAGWSGGQRLEFWQRSSDQSRASQIWLAHDAEPESLVVGTLDPLDVPADSLDLAEEMAIKLVNIGLPGPEVPRTDGFGTRLVGHALDVAARHAQWPTMPVTIEGQPSHLRYQEFAGCWAGTVDGYSVGAYGVGDRPDTLALAEFVDTTPYGFDLTNGVRFADMKACEFGKSPEGWHPDHRFLL